MGIDKKSLSEEDIKMKYITPAVQKVGWDVERQIRAEYTFTDGRVIVRGNMTSRGKKKRADYILLYKPNIPIAIIEAKDNNHSVGSGMQQGLDYAEILDIPYVYSSNGDGFLEHDIKNGTEREFSMDDFPSPDELWARFKGETQLDDEQEKLVLEPYYFQVGDKTPRYYQRVAINRTVEAVARGQNRILLVMATGTGKTYTAFQIIYRLRKSELKKKILYLADRNILIDQTMQQDFKPFEKVMTKIENRKMDSSYEIYLSLYQQMTGDDNMEIFRQFKPDFFDLIIIDECHRGSAKEESRWRRILEYFSSATQIGMTATPKETDETSNIHYFGKPIYTYSLKQGIEDGFLAPYKVIRIGLDKDLTGYRPEAGKVDVYGNEIEDREYNINDFDRSLIIDDRTKNVAKKITEFLKKTDRFSKTIVFCINIDHAERMRQALIKENSDLDRENSKYVMRITGDNDVGKKQLDNFIDLDSKYPVIVTTSKLMTTGVDCKTCKVIVLDNIFGDNGMTEFKQIIGRGTRLKPEYGKEFFTIIDFRNASRLFADPNFDGEPVQVYEPQEGEDILPPEETGESGTDTTTDDGGADNPTGGFGGDWGGDGGEKPKVYRVNDVPVRVISERVQYIDKNGKLITESLVDYTRKNLLEQFASLDNFLNIWGTVERKQAIIDELQEHGVLLDALKEEVGDKELDDFDLICHIAFDKKPLTKAERANNVKKRGYLYKYSETAQQVLEALLDKYKDDGIFEIEDTKVLELKDFERFGSPLKIVKLFGGKDGYRKAIKELETEIYSA